MDLCLSKSGAVFVKKWICVCQKMKLFLSKKCSCVWPKSGAVFGLKVELCLSKSGSVFVKKWICVCQKVELCLSKSGSVFGQK